MSILDPGAGNQEASGVNQESSAESGDKGGQVERQWMADLSEPLKGSKSLTKFSDDSWKENLAKSYIELEGKLGNSVQIPGKDAAPDQWEKFFSRIGRPESPEKYELKDVPDDRAKVLKAAAFKAGLNPKQAAELASAIAASDAEQSKSAKDRIDAEYNAAVSLLKREYGDQYEAKVASAVSAMDSLFPSLRGRAEKLGLDNDPAFIKDLVALGERLGDDGLVKGGAKTAAKKDSYDWMREYFKQ